MQSSTPLPEGLSIDAMTGKPVREMEQRALTVRGKNPTGEMIGEITMAVRKGYCQPEGVFERTNVGEVAVYECSMQGSYVGTQKSVHSGQERRRVAEGDGQLPAHYGNRDYCDSGYRCGRIHPAENEKEQVGWRREGEGCEEDTDEEDDQGCEGLNCACLFYMSLGVHFGWIVKNDRRRMGMTSMLCILHLELEGV